VLLGRVSGSSSNVSIGYFGGLQYFN